MKLYFFISFLLLQPLLGFSQTEINVDYKNTSLKTVIADIESQTELLFSYKESIVSNKTITLTVLNISIKQLLNELTKQTNLQFQRVSNQQIIITGIAKKITICGYIFDHKTNTALATTEIFINDGITGTTTNEDGYFELKSVDKESLVILKYLGYETLRLKAKTLKNDDCKTIFLKKRYQSLNDVVINAYITDGLDINNDGSIDVTTNRLKILPGQAEPDIFESLAVIPGINSLNESVSDIQIRGGSKDQNLILLDDIKLYNTGHFFGMLSAVNPYMVKQAKIYKSGASAQYGDRISGIVDISSFDEIPDSTRAGFGLNGTHIDGFIKSPLGQKTAVQVALRRSYVDVFTSPTFDAFSEKIFENSSLFIGDDGTLQTSENIIDNSASDNQFYFFDTMISSIYKPTEKDKIGISSLLTTNDLDFTTRFEEDQILDKLNIDNRGLSMNWTHNVNSKLSYNSSIYYSYFKSLYENTVSFDNIPEEFNRRFNKVGEFGFNFHFDLEFENMNKLKIGYQLSEIDVSFALSRQLFEAEFTNDDANFSSTIQNLNTTNTLYSEYIFRPKEHSFFNIGLRASNYSLVDKFYLEPRLNIQYPITKSIRIKATAEQRFQAISELVQFEDTSLRLDNQIWSLSGTEDLPILSSNQFSGGLIYDDDNFTIDIDTYIKNIKGLTSFTNGFTNATEEFSEGESDIFGIDFLLKKSFNHLDFWIGYSFNEVKYSFNEIELEPFRGNNDITHNFKISTNYKLENWQLSLGWNYRTGSPFTPIEGYDAFNEDILFGDINSLRLPDYHRLDASVIYNFHFSRLKNIEGTFSLSAQNIYGRQVPLSVSYRVDTNQLTDTQQVNRIEQLSLGFTPNATLRIRF